MGGYPYGPPPTAPRGYGYGGDTVGDLLRDQGRIGAESAQRSGDLWGNAFRDIGATLSGGIQQNAEEKKAKKAAEGLAKQDAAFVSLLGSGDVSPASIVRIYGPQRGMDIAKGYAALQTPKPDPQAVLAAMKASSEPMRAQAWPSVRQTMIQTHTLPEEAIPPQYDPEWFNNYYSQMNPTKPTAPVTVKGDERLIDPATGRVITDAAPAAPKPPGTHVVGGALVGDDGHVIYRDPNAGADNRTPISVMGDDGQPVYVRPSDAYGKRPASGKEQGRPVVSGDAGRVAEMDTALDDLNTLSASLSGNGATGVQAQAGAALPNFVTAWTGIGADAKKKQAVIDRVKQVIGKTLEGGVLRKEDELKYEKILPTISDPPDVAAAKLDGLYTAVGQRRQTLIDSLGDAGYEVGKYNERAPRTRGGAAPTAPGAGRIPTASSPEEARRLPPGSQFRTPDGRVMRVPAR